jgi:hypothetical protein
LNWQTTPWYTDCIDRIGGQDEKTVSCVCLRVVRVRATSRYRSDP